MSCQQKGDLRGVNPGKTHKNGRGRETFPHNKGWTSKSTIGDSKGEIVWPKERATDLKARYFNLRRFIKRDGGASSMSGDKERKVCPKRIRISSRSLVLPKGKIEEGQAKETGQKKNPFRNRHGGRDLTGAD